MAAYTTIDDAGSFFNILLYTGTGSSNVLTGVGFQSDLIWTATRNEVQIHPVNSSVSGISNYLRSNANDTLETSSSETITAQSSDGYTVGTENRFNKSSNTFVSWNWKAGTTSGITTDGNTDITPSAYSFSAAAGISILQYTGNATPDQKVAHGLGTAPEMIIIKKTDGTANWAVYHQKMDSTAPEDYYQQLDANSARANNNSFWNDTAPDSVNFTLGDSGDTNGSSNVMIAYCFAPKQGYSKLGGYIGNGNADGTFVYTGFRPAFLLMKRADSTGNWTIWDSKRAGYNSVNDEIYANTTAAEGTGNVYLNFLSNGFKWLEADGMVNASGGEYIYMAFAQSPFVNSEGVANNAR